MVIDTEEVSHNSKVLTEMQTITCTEWFVKHRLIILIIYQIIYYLNDKTTRIYAY